MVIKLKEAVSYAGQNDNMVSKQVSDILHRIKTDGDSALLEYNKKYDNFARENVLISEEEIQGAYKLVNTTTIEDLRFAAKNIGEFAKRQKQILHDIKEEILPGVILGHRVIPIAAVAGYVPGGRYPLPSSALMSMIPAKVAGVKRTVACSPKAKDQDSIHPATIVAMHISGTNEIYCMGGAQAIAALAYGTETIKPVNLIAGPGNQYVTEAKRQVNGEVGIDFLAGPSEVLIIADQSADPKYIAADLLAQSEHDPLARGILLCTDAGLGESVLKQVDEYLRTLPTAVVARESWKKFGEIIVFDTLAEAAAFANQVAPEHLEIQVGEPEKIKPLLINYGSLFVGQGAAEVFGDYSAGTNHILPTMRTACFTGGVWVGTFLKVITDQSVTREGAALIGPVASRLAKLEGLYAHKLAADLRSKKE